MIQHHPSPNGAATCPRQRATFDRRSLLVGCGAAAAALAAWPLVRRLIARREAVFLARNQRYDGDLQTTITDGLAAVGFDLTSLRGKTVLLKPNMVEPRRDAPQLSTHPAVVVAAAEVFGRHGARVVVGEAPGHLRDTQLALDESGIGEALDDAKLPFADLNYQDVKPLTNALRASPLKSIYFPRAVHEADLVVSLPKLKTHHWVGMTASMKNLYGLLPGIKYGWPKNVLHYAGVPETVVDINATVPRAIAIVDAIDCMEGDGPIMGSRKHLGMIAVGTNLAALDATCARVMGFEPARISYLQLAGALGPIADSQIEQPGEAWQVLRSPFQVLDVPHLNELRDAGVLIS
ncbi:MAG: DUF362 domain-containing protein [Planctomycetia bacterium]|nr:DUF362 domain-containing protein [Planctomycetia bacterium]